MSNVALVVLDTLRKDSFDEYFDWLPGRRFENAWAPGGWTIPVHSAMFTGKYASEVGVHIKNEFLDCDEAVLAESLKEADYTTRAYSCNPCISSTFNFDRGFDHFDGNWRQLKRDPEIFNWNDFITRHNDSGPERYLRALYECVTSDCNTIPSLRFGARLKLRDIGYRRLANIEDDGAASAISYAKSTEFGTDEFIFFNLMEAHAPYDPPDKYNTTGISYSPSLLGTVGDTDADPELLRQAYDDSVRYLSDKYRELFEILAEDFDVIITLGDHGEMFGDDGIWGHGHSVHPQLTQVPLSIYTGKDESEQTDKTVSLIDIHETILNYAGIEAESRGQDLLGQVESREYLTERFGLNKRRRDSLRESGIDPAVIDRYDTILRGITFPERYYAYQTLDGVAEWEDRGDIDPEARLQATIAQLDIREIDEKSGQELPDDVMDQLEDLGYA